MRKRVVGTSILVVVGALVVWCANRWKAWFHNPDEAPYEAAATPSRVLLTFGDENGLNRNVSWTCGDEVCDAFVELLDETDSLFRKVKAEGEVFVSRGGGSCYYVARLRGLDAGHSYR
ncbi:MAG: serine/threonine protein phosphatase, partial [Bacteroidaceae bacterium]|nr:serine/threonine protein phosphatase [Bacteroidaceae bacterium]